MLLAFALVFVVARGDLFRATSTTTSVPVISSCLGSQLDAAWVDGTAGAGTAYAWITLTNNKETCSLPAWLNMAMGGTGSASSEFTRIGDLTELTKPDGKAIPKSLSRITLATGETATVAISFSNRSGCDVSTMVTLSWLRGAELQVHPVIANYLVSQCNGPSAFFSPVFR